MIIPLIAKDHDRNDFTCRDGEIDFIIRIDNKDEEDNTASTEPFDTTEASATCGIGTSSILHRLTAELTYPKVNIRIPLQNGEKEKAALLINGEASRVDPATADRITQAIVEKAAETLLDLSTDLRRQGLFILPFRVYSMVMKEDGVLSYPSAQAIALPSEYPPSPEITAGATTDDSLTLSLRFPVKPHRLSATSTTALPAGQSLRTFISYPLYIPDAKEMRGSIGSVRSATGGNTTGIRFSFLSKASIKASVAAPEKYYELVGNERTGYRLSSKAAKTPDYSEYSSIYGYVAPFLRESLIALGEETPIDTDPLDWIADWKGHDDGYLPMTLPYKHWTPMTDNNDPSGSLWPEGIDINMAVEMADSLQAHMILLTRPMTFASDALSRRHAVRKGIRTLRVLGLPPGKPALALLYGSDDGVRWQALRKFNPKIPTLVQAPPRLFWRLLIIGTFSELAMEVSTL